MAFCTKCGPPNERRGALSGAGGVAGLGSIFLLIALGRGSSAWWRLTPQRDRRTSKRRLFEDRKDFLQEASPAPWCAFRFLLSKDAASYACRAVASSHRRCAYLVGSPSGVDIRSARHNQ
jgi:hypothetical protein